MSRRTAGRFPVREEQNSANCTPRPGTNKVGRIHAKPGRSEYAAAYKAVVNDWRLRDDTQVDTLRPVHLFSVCVGSDTEDL
jgi:hypothetical protein